MNETKTFDLLVEMNPVPHPDLLDMSPFDERSGDMQTVMRTEEHEQRIAPRLQGWKALVAAAAVVAAVAGGAWLAGNGDGGFAGGDTATARATEELLGAFNEGDWDTFAAGFAPDASLSAVYGWRFLPAAVAEAPGTAPSSFGFQLLGNCVEPRRNLVRCELRQRGDAFDRIGVPISGTATVIYDDAGLVYAMNLDSRFQLDAVTTIGEWASWLRTVHPQIFAATFDATLPETVPPNIVDTVDNRAIWNSVVGEYLES